MSEADRAAMLAELSRGAEQWAEWRSTRKVGTRVPRPLWELAVDLAAKYGVSRTAAALRIGYDALKKRFQTSRASASGDSAAAKGFVELRPFASDAGTTVGDCQIEFEKGSGARMRIRLSGTRLFDLTALSRSFWEAP